MIHTTEMAASKHRPSAMWIAIVLAIVAATPIPALAGMPSYSLTDLARLRVQSISFFLLLFFLSAAVVMGIWNALQRDFIRLPRLTYPRALSLVAIWGLLFLLVLTMISGARELLTPGAWEKRGATYRLTDVPVMSDSDRQAHLLALKIALWKYAESHDGSFPPDDRDPVIAPATWETPDVTRASYLYLPGRRVGNANAIVAYEPRVLGSPRFVLFADGQIRSMSDREIDAALHAEKTQ